MRTHRLYAELRQAPHRPADTCCIECILQSRREANVPIFARHGNRMVAINPALVRAVDPQKLGGCKIIFDQQHEVLVDGSLHEVVNALWGQSPRAEIKELALIPNKL